MGSVAGIAVVNVAAGVWLCEMSETRPISELMIYLLTIALSILDVAWLGLLDGIAALAWLIIGIFFWALRPRNWTSMARLRMVRSLLAPIALAGCHPYSHVRFEGGVFAHVMSELFRRSHVIDSRLLDVMLREIKWGRAGARGPRAHKCTVVVSGAATKSLALELAVTVDRGIDVAHGAFIIRDVGHMEWQRLLALILERVKNERPDASDC